MPASCPLRGPRKYDILKWRHWLEEMLRPALESGGWEETSGERHQGDHRAAGLGLSEEAEASDRDRVSSLVQN